MGAAFDGKQLESALESLLFVSDEPVSVVELAEVMDVDAAVIQKALEELSVHLQENERGIQLREVAGGWRFFTHPAYHELVEQFVVSWDRRRLTQASLETLAIVAYAQPITRAGVSAVRGVNSDSSMNSLLDKNLIREAGTAEAPGNPMLYATTRRFLEHFGLKDLADLPDLTEFAPDDETRNLIRERLSVTRVSDAAIIPEDPSEDALELDGVVFDFSDDDERVELSSALDSEGENAGGAERDLLARALASGLGLVEKIDFDELDFDD